MRNLPLCFKFFTWCGFWRPFDVSPSMKFLYNACSASAFLIVCTFTISEFLDIVINIDNINDFMNNSCILIEMIAICYKAITILVRRERFLKVLDMLLEASCKVRNDAEQRIQDKFNRLARDSTQNYAIVLMTSTTFLILLAFFKIPEHELPFRAWLPYSISPLLLYWVSFFHQIAALLIGSILSIGYDTFIPGLMIEVCAQLEILRYRFTALANKEFTDDTNDDREEEVLKGCIRHHCHIIKFASTVENNFHVVIFLQCFVSLVSLCASVFQLLKMNIFSMQFVSMSLYLTVMLFQLFVYCWYGNEVILKSTEINDAIFKTNWGFLKNSTKRDLIIVMIRAQRAIEFTSGYVITLSLESYVAILKASYSVYNALQ